jgi:hypothetical protein
MYQFFLSSFIHPGILGKSRQAGRQEIAVITILFSVAERLDYKVDTILF